MNAICAHSQPDKPQRPHLRAGIISAAITVGLAIFVILVMPPMETRAMRFRGWEYSSQKNQGVVWQRAAFSRTDTLPLYGSSEVTKTQLGEDYRFFEEHPNGFVVSPTGRGGCTSLILMEKIAAAGQRTPHHKLVVCLSPSWFFTFEPHHRWYAGNFSPRQAAEVIFSRHLSIRLRRDIARRMLLFPDTLERSSIVSFAVRRLVTDSYIDTFLYRAVMPIGILNNLLGEACEQVESSGDLFGRWPASTASIDAGKRLDWHQYLRQAAQHPSPFLADRSSAKVGYPFSGRADFEQMVGRAGEWKDFELLLRVCDELDLDPLILCIPMNAQYFAGMGIPRESLGRYRERLREVTASHHAVLVDFAAEELNPAFCVDHRDHPSRLGWIMMNRAMADHFHNLPPRSREPSSARGELADGGNDAIDHP